MAHTTAVDIAHTPLHVVLAAIRERQARRNALINSAVVMRDDQWAVQALSKGGIQLEIPVYNAVTGTYTVQNPGTAPAVTNITTGVQFAPVCYREKAWGRDAFSVSQTDVDPINLVADRILNLRADKQESQIIAQLTGIFKSDDFAAFKFGTAANEAPVGTPGSNLYWTPNVFHDTVGLLSLDEDDLAGGCIWMHPLMRTYLKKEDELDTVKASDGSFTLQTYKGLRVIVDNRLRRAGTTSGFVYQVYIGAPGSVVVSEAPQSQDGTTSSSLAYVADVPNLQAALYDRVVDIVHVNGANWSPATATGGALTIARGGPADAHFATANAWTNKFATSPALRVVRAEVNVV